MFDLLGVIGRLAGAAGTYPDRVARGMERALVRVLAEVDVAAVVALLTNHLGVEIRNEK